MEWLVRHVHRHFSARCAGLGERRTREWVDAGYRRANEYGFTTRANICRFVALMFACGERFDVEERWAVGILTGAPGMDETLKSQWLGDAGIRSSER